MEKVAQVDDHHVSTRNAMYFAHMTNDNVMEEYAYGFKLENMLGAFNQFFGEDADYLAFKQTLPA